MRESITIQSPPGGCWWQHWLSYTFHSPPSVTKCEKKSTCQANDTTSPFFTTWNYIQREVGRSQLAWEALGSKWQGLWIGLHSKLRGHSDRNWKCVSQPNQAKCSHFRTVSRASGSTALCSLKGPWKGVCLCRVCHYLAFLCCANIRYWPWFSQQLCEAAVRKCNPF